MARPRTIGSPLVRRAAVNKHDRRAFFTIIRNEQRSGKGHIAVRKAYFFSAIGFCPRDTAFHHKAAVYAKAVPFSEKRISDHSAVEHDRVAARLRTFEPEALAPSRDRERNIDHVQVYKIDKRL